jgi:alpha-mannosidase
MMPGLADHLAAPPAAFSHLPYDAEITSPNETLLSLKPASVRLLACKRSWEGEALIVRLQEAVGRKTKAELKVVRLADGSGTRTSGTCPRSRGKHAPRGSGLPGRAVPPVHVPLSFTPFEIKTVRVERDGTWRAVALFEELPA